MRFRTWNKHREKGFWYPSKRSFAIPVQHAGALAQALPAAVEGRFGRKRDWLISREQAEAEALQRLIESGATEEVVNGQKAKLARYRKKRA